MGVYISIWHEEPTKILPKKIKILADVQHVQTMKLLADAWHEQRQLVRLWVFTNTIKQKFWIDVSNVQIVACSNFIKKNLEML